MFIIKTIIKFVSATALAVTKYYLREVLKVLIAVAVGVAIAAIIFLR